MRDPIDRHTCDMSWLPAFVCGEKFLPKLVLPMPWGPYIKQVVPCDPRHVEINRGGIGSSDTQDLQCDPEQRPAVIKETALLSGKQQ